MSAERCIKEIKAAAGVDLTDDELTDIVEYLDNVKRARLASRDQSSIEEGLLNIADELSADIIETAKIEKRNRLINIQRKQELMTVVAAADDALGNPALGLKAAMVGVSRVFQGSRDSVDARGMALSGEYLGGLIANLRKENLLLEFNSKEFELDLARDLSALTDPGARPSGNPKTKRIAEIVDQYRRAALGRANRAGAWIKPLPGYITRQTHDMGKIRRAGADEWKRVAIDLLDPKTFEGANPDEFLNAVFDALKSGVHLKHGADNSLTFAFKGPGNLAKRLSQSRSLHFRDADAFMEYNRLFGQRSLTEGIFTDLERLARSTALMEKFGTNPRAMFDSVRQELIEKNRGDHKKLEALRGRDLDNQFDQIDGSANIAHNATLAQVASDVRSIQAMSKLGGAALSALSDVGFQSAEIHRQGIPVMQSWKKAFENVVDGLTTDGDRQEFADLMGVGIDGQLGDVYGRFSADSSPSGALNKGMRFYFKANLLTPWTDANKRGFALMFARELGMKKDLSFSGLHPDMQRLMTRYNITGEKWDIVRKAVVKADDGREYLVPSEIKNLPDDLFAGTARQIARQKDDLETSIRSLLVDRTDFAVLTPGARERANPLLGGGTQKGTGIGEAVRFMSQFKAFPITAATRGFGEAFFSKGATSFREALLKGKADISGLASLIIGTTVLGYVAQSAKELTKGRKPRDPAEFGTWKAALLQGGGLGIYGDFLLGETNRFGNSLLDTLAGPTFGTISDVDKIRAKLLAGEDVDADMLRLAMSNTPFLNLFYTRTALDYLILYQLQEAASPGYLRRTERRLKRENNQEFIIPPSQVVPRGG